MWTALADSAPGAASNTVLVAVISSLGSALLVFAGQLLLRKQQKDNLIAETTERVVNSANTMLLQLEKDVAEGRAEVVKLRERIAILESDLGKANADVARLQEERKDALDRLAATQRNVKQLEEQVRALEESTERRHRTPPSPPHSGSSP